MKISFPLKKSPNSANGQYYKDLTGFKFGNNTVVGPIVLSTVSPKIRWRVVCACGVERTMRSDDIIQNRAADKCRRCWTSTVANIKRERHERTKKEHVKTIQQPSWNRNTGAQKSSTQLSAALRAVERQEMTRNGWPDAATVEQKIGRDSIDKNQWIRAAWLFKKYNIVVSLFWSKNHLNAVVGKFNKHHFDFVTYLEDNYVGNKPTNFRERWDRLVEIVPELESEDRKGGRRLPISQGKPITFSRYEEKA